MEWYWWTETANQKLTSKGLGRGAKIRIFVSLAFNKIMKHFSITKWSSSGAYSRTTQGWQPIAEKISKLKKIWTQKISWKFQFSTFFFNFEKLEKTLSKLQKIPQFQKISKQSQENYDIEQDLRKKK